VMARPKREYVSHTSYSLIRVPRGGDASDLRMLKR
jgi:hypothetical protein